MERASSDGTYDSGASHLPCRRTCRRRSDPRAQATCDARLKRSALSVAVTAPPTHDARRFAPVCPLISHVGAGASQQIAG